MKWKLLRARTTRINHAPAAPRHELEHYCRDLNGWPRSWMGLEKDLPPGEQLLILFRPFLEHLAASGLSPKTIQNCAELTGNPIPSRREFWIWHATCVVAAFFGLKGKRRHTVMT